MKAKQRVRGYMLLLSGYKLHGGLPVSKSEVA